MNGSGESGGADRFRPVRELFEELAELESGEREIRLGAIESGDPALVGELRSLFDSDRAAGAFLDQPAVAFASDLVREIGAEAEAGTAVGRVVGAWRLIAPLGRGGMGEVYVAERVDGDYQQRAALKLVRRGMDSAEIVRRFVLERRILARLEHPGIARLLDGGQSDDGRPYLVLELVDGLPITEHCRKTGAGVEARIRLLLEACDAVESAHRKLVVHRDLKPSNVLVENAGGRVKLLDFGIAKLLSGEEGNEPQLTRTGFAVMTPAYASPEQILGEPATTATDVYALGVLLFELLTGRLPHERPSSSAAALADAVSRESAVKPSRIAAESGDRKLERTLSGDLDTIALKALAREPERRYGSAAALADDLRRYLDGRPVRARRDSAGYRMRKFVGRHPGTVAASVAAVAALALGLALALAQAQRADREAAAARREAARAERVRQFLTTVFEVSDPVKARGEVVTAKNLLDEGARRVEHELAGDADLRAEMQHVLAGLFRKLGDLPTARDLAEKSLATRVELAGAESAAAAKVEWTLGWALSTAGEFVPARQHLEHAIATLDRVEGVNSLAAADAREPLMELVFGADGPAATLPIVEHRLATYRAVAGQRDVRTALSLSDLGVVFGELDREPEAEVALREAAAILDDILPPGDPRGSYPHNNLANILMSRDKLDEAEVEARKALDIRVRALGPLHPETTQSRGQVIQVLIKMDRLDEAEALARENLASVEGKNPFLATQARAALGQILLAGKRWQEALALFEQSIEERKGLFPPDHPLVFAARINRVKCLTGLGRLAEARSELTRLIPELEKKGPEGAQNLQRTREILRKLDGEGGAS